ASLRRGAAGGSMLDLLPRRRRLVSEPGVVRLLACLVGVEQVSFPQCVSYPPWQRQTDDETSSGSVNFPVVLLQPLGCFKLSPAPRSPVVHFLSFSVPPGCSSFSVSTESDGPWPP